MTINLLLSVALAFVFFYAISQRHTSRLTYLTGMLALAGVYFVWFPEHTTEIANFLGVGRGTDLLLYCCVVITLLVTVSVHIQLRKHLDLITRLARHVALNNATEGQGPNPTQNSAVRNSRES